MNELSAGSGTTVGRLEAYDLPLLFSSSDFQLQSVRVSYFLRIFSPTEFLSFFTVHLLILIVRWSSVVANLMERKHVCLRTVAEPRLQLLFRPVSDPRARAFPPHCSRSLDSLSLSFLSCCERVSLRLPLVMSIPGI